tara:strand:+ start:2657 stop:6121 length:3465 start_codon:yes stop_codon:yes gene_type:complete
MADKTPVRVVFNSSNVATGMAEFQSGETVPVANGGTGLSSIGSAGQILKVNAAGSGLEFGAEGDISITNLVAPTNADLTFTTSGTGNIVLDAVTVNGTTLSAADSTKITVAEALDVTGALVAGTSINIAGDGATVTGIKDEDNMASNSDTKLATQQSIKAYVDSEVGSVSTTAISQLNSNVTVADAGSGTITVTVDGSTIGDFTASGLQLGGSGARVTTVLDEDGFGTNSDTSLATQQSIKAYVDAQITAEDLDITADDSTAIAIDLDSEVLHFAGGNGISTSVSSNTVTTAIDTGTVVTLTDSQTLTNKVLNNPTINAFSGTGNGSITGTLSLVTTTTGDSLLITTTEDSNSAAPVFSLKRNSSSPANADYLGRIKFKGENDADQEVQYASISGKIIDVADGSEDGAVEFNIKKAGSNNIAARLSSTELKLLNGTTLDVDGAGTFAGVVTATSVTANDFTSNGSNADITIAPQGTGDINLTAGADVNIPANIGITFGDDGEKIEGDGTDLTISSSRHITFDAGNDITLDAGSGGIKFDDDGTTIGLLFNNSSNLVIKAVQQDKDLQLKGNDGGGEITALTLDMSEAGAATFNSTVTVSGAMTATSVTANDFTSNGSNADITIAPQGTGDINLTAGADVNIPANIGVTFGDNGEKIEGDGTDLTIATSNNITIDAVGDIILDAGGTEIKFLDDGTQFGHILKSGNNLELKSSISDGDLTFHGNDGGSAIEALKLDMSAAGAATFNDAIILGTNKEIQFVDTNESIKSDGSKIIIKSGGTTFNLPTADGSDGQALVTNGSGTLSFGTVGDPDASDDTNASVLSNKRITTTARAIDSFGETFQDSVLYYVCTNDHHLDTVNLQKVSLVHNDTAPFFATTGVASGTGTMTTFTTDSSNNVVRLKAASTNAVGGNVSYYKFGLGDNSTAATSGNIIVTQNTDVDSASEAVTSFAHADFRGAKLFISINNDSKTEVTNMEGLVVHDGSDAFITTYNVVNTGNNTLATFTATISGDNVVISAAGLEPNLRITVHAIMLKDTMVANSGTYSNSEAIAPVTISSSATSFDTFAQKTTNGAVYFLVSKNASEGHFAINEIIIAFGSDNITHANAGFVSTKATNQIAVTTEIKDDTELTGDVKISSTSGASTTVSAYKIKLHAS